MEIKTAECINIISDYYKTIYSDDEKEKCERNNEAVKMAIDSMVFYERVSNWIGTKEAVAIAELVHREGIEAVGKACEKQIPKKPNNIELAKTDDGINYGECPNCGTVLNDWDNPKGCDECLQAIDWSEQ